jgi:hypothetical protein
VIEAPAREHSTKPDEAYELIEAYFPNLRKVELFARRRREGWAVWGDEAPQEEAATIAAVIDPSAPGGSNSTSSTGAPLMPGQRDVEKG